MKESKVLFTRLNGGLVVDRKRGNSGDWRFLVIFNMELMEPKLKIVKFI